MAPARGARALVYAKRFVSGGSGRGEIALFVGLLLRERPLSHARAARGQAPILPPGARVEEFAAIQGMFLLGVVKREFFQPLLARRFSFRFAGLVIFA